MTQAAASDDEGHGFSRTVVPRHGRRPLGFTGRMLFRVGNEALDLPVRSEITVFETQDARFVATISHRSAAPGLFSYADARLCGVAAEVHAMFAGHQPDALLPVEVLVPPWHASAAERAGLRGEVALRVCEQQLLQMRGEWRKLLAAAFGKHANVQQKP